MPCQLCSNTETSPNTAMPRAWMGTEMDDGAAEARAAEDEADAAMRLAAPAGGAEEEAAGAIGDLDCGAVKDGGAAPRLFGMESENAGGTAEAGGAELREEVKAAVD